MDLFNMTLADFMANIQEFLVRFGIATVIVGYILIRAGIDAYHYFTDKD